MKKSVENIVRHSEVSEKAIEKYLSGEVAKAGGICLKYSNPNMAGYPDRVAVMPEGVSVWVELKSKGRKPNKLQAARIESMRRLGHRVYVIDSRQGVDLMLGEI